MRPVALILLLFAVSSCGPCGRPADPAKESALRVEDIVKKSGVPFASLEKLGVELDASRRNCNLKYESDPDDERSRRNVNLCSADAEKALMGKAGVPPDAAVELTKAHFILRWEQKDFLSRKKTTEAELVRVFQAAWLHVERCEKQVTALPGESAHVLNIRRNRCSGPGLYGACGAAGHNKDDCGRIIAMGLAYGWIPDKVTRRVRPSADRKL